MDSSSSPNNLSPELPRPDGPDARARAEDRGSTSDVFPVANPSPFRDREDSGTVARPSEAPRAVLRDGVRRAIYGDASVLSALQVIAREHGAEQGVLPPPEVHDFDKLVDLYVERLREQQRVRTFLALTRGEPTGFATAGASRSGISWEGEIYALHVHPRFWRTRVPKNLVAACVDFLHQRGFSALRMWVTAQNRELCDGLLSQGFVVLEERVHPRHGQRQEAFVRRLP